MSYTESSDPQQIARDYLALSPEARAEYVDPRDHDRKARDARWVAARFRAVLKDTSRLY